MAMMITVGFNRCCDAFIRHGHFAFKTQLSCDRYHHAATNGYISPLTGIQSIIQKKFRKPGLLPNKVLAATYTGSDVDNGPRQHRRWFKLPFLERSHEKIISLVFGGMSGTVLYFAGIHSQTDGLPPIEPGKWLIMAETSLALSWSSMIVAISFLEAWTKFRAPFLKKYVAVDVGRHVFAAFNSAELGIAAAFWLHRLFLCCKVQQILGGGILFKSKSYYEQFSFTLPAAATISLLAQVLVIAPKLYRRAKRRILDGFDESLPSVKISMTKAEQVALIDISQDFRRSKKIPSRLWHSLYALLEIVKMGCLNAFVILSWLKILQ